VISDGLQQYAHPGGKSLSEGGDGLAAYADAVVLYLSFCVSRLASYCNTICHWNLKGGSVSQILISL